MFEQVSDDGLDSDSDGDDVSDNIDKGEKSLVGNDMTEDEMAARLNRFKSFEATGSSPATPSNRRGQYLMAWGMMMNTKKLIWKALRK